MAGKIFIVASLRAENKTFKIPTLGSAQVTVVQNGFGGGSPGEVIVGQLPVQVDLSGLTDVGWCRMQNLDATQSVRWAFTSAALATSGLMKPGEPAVFRLGPSSQLWLQVDPATEEVGSTSVENQARVQTTIVED